MIDLYHIQQAADQLRGQIHRTPLFSSRFFSAQTGMPLRLKAENLQKTGSFKIRGALNKLLSLSPSQRQAGVVAFSSGNHAQGVALAAQMLGIAATIVMPEDSVPLKVLATKGYGATVVIDNVKTATRSTVALEIAERTGATLIHPFDDPLIMAGQGTVGLEIYQDWPEVEQVVVCLGGGGLLSGVAMAVTSLNPNIRVYGVEPQAGNDGQQSFQKGQLVHIDPPTTLADGAKTTALGEQPFAVIKERVTDIVTVTDEQLMATMKSLALYCKLVAEPTGALALSALLTGKIPTKGRTVAILSGGNVTPACLAEALTQS